MTNIPEYNFKRFPDSGWKPDKQEQYNLRYWKAKQAKKKPTTKAPFLPKERRSIESKATNLEEAEQKLLDFISDAPVSLTINDDMIEQHGFSINTIQVLLARKLIRVGKDGYEPWT